MRTNHIKARIDKIQQNSNCLLCGDRDETINHIIREGSKLAHKIMQQIKNIRLDTTGSESLSTGKCARHLNLTTPTNGKFTTQHLS